MVKIICSTEKGGCGICYEIDEEAVKKDRYIQCPWCLRISENPLFEP